MVSFKYLLLGVAAIVSVLAQDPTGNEAEATTFWESGAQGAEGAPAEKRDFKLPRNDPCPINKDPYKGFYCRAPYTLPPCETKCNRNNCFRGFLNARDGSDGKHCPIEAFGFCCLWNWAPPYYKYIGVKKGLVYKFAPYSKNCKNDGDSWGDVVAKINDVCGCTLNHEVYVDICDNKAYWQLRYFWYGNDKCH